MKRQERLEQLQNKVSAVFHPYTAKIKSYSPDGRQRRYAVYLYKDGKAIDMFPKKHIPLKELEETIDRIITYNNYMGQVNNPRDNQEKSPDKKLYHRWKEARGAGRRDVLIEAMDRVVRDFADLRAIFEDMEREHHGITQAMSDELMEFIYDDDVLRKLNWIKAYVEKSV